MTKPEATRGVLTKNKTEELGADVWLNFVVPRFFNRLDLYTARKPRFIIGGRGCGKTMLLRYLSHESAFSPKRSKIPDEALRHIGLFWRADTQFSTMMTKRGIPDDVWVSAFSHMAALILGIELIRSLQSIGQSACPLISEDDVAKLDFGRLHAFDPELPSTSDKLIITLEQNLWTFQSWVSNVRSGVPPYFLPGERFVRALIEIIGQQLPAIAQSTFFVYLDEYENLAEYQQRIINSWLKHSEHPLIFNVAMKRNAFKVRQTLGPESLSDIHDYRTHDLELYLAEEFDVFAAEVLFLNLALDQVLESPVQEQLLRDPNRLAERKTPEYKKRILTAAQSLFPDVSQEQLARGVFEEPALTQKLRERIRFALQRRHSKLTEDRFFRPSFPEASIVSPVLLHRPKLLPEDIATEFDLFSDQKESRFKDWVHNNFVGALLLLYGPHSRACPFYAGFHTFCHLSHGNLRHFRELCHKSIDQASADLGTIAWPISPEFESEAARQASTAFLGEIRSFGRFGNQLHAFVYRLGTVFELAQQRPSQSESERNHFAITSGRAALEEGDYEFLSEAVKWSVLFEEPGTKKKDQSIPESTEYVLNPIYAPYFHISYRKKRRIDLSSDDTIVLIRGTVDEIKALYNRFSKDWDVEPSAVIPSLFSAIDREHSA